MVQYNNWFSCISTERPSGQKFISLTERDGDEARISNPVTEESEERCVWVSHRYTVPGQDREQYCLTFRRLDALPNPCSASWQMEKSQNESEGNRRDMIDNTYMLIPAATMHNRVAIAIT